jgi:hypothetical protein
MKKVLCLMSCAILLSGAFHSVAASSPGVEQGATKVVKASASFENCFEFRANDLFSVDAIYITAPELPRSFVATVFTMEATINPVEAFAYRVTENKLASNYKNGYRPPAFRPEKTGKS